jgi:hypothetical protein
LSYASPSYQNLPFVVEILEGGRYKNTNGFTVIASDVSRDVIGGLFEDQLLKELVGVDARCHFEV